MLPTTQENKQKLADSTIEKKAVETKVSSNLDPEEAKQPQGEFPKSTSLKSQVQIVGKKHLKISRVFSLF